MSRRDQQPLLLAIDNGTQSIRAMLFDLQGNLVDLSKLELTPYFSKKPGWAEQDPDYYWKTLAQACQQLWLNNPANKSRIKGVSITTQRGTYVCVDNEGKPLRPAITWLDQRRAKRNGISGRGWNLLITLSGMKTVFEQFCSRCYSQWLAENEPEVWQKTDKYLLLSGWQIFKLTGRFRDSSASQVGYIPFNYKKQQWASPRNWKWRATGIQPSQLPELISPGKTLGYITPEAEQTTGIPQGLPLIAAAADKACEVLGSGVLDSSTGCLSYGTTATFNTVHHRYIEPRFLIPPWPSAIPDTWNTEFMVYRGYWMISWFKKQFGHPEVTQAQQQGLLPEKLLERLLRETPPGAMGLMLQPHWSPGLQNQEAKGCIIGFGDIHNRAHIYRAIVEGIAYGLREGKENLEKRSGQKIKYLIASGGGAQSDDVLQITADIFNLSVGRPHTFETSGLGAAINTAVGLGLYPDYKAAVSKMTHVSKTFEPNPDNTELYEQLYSQVYLKIDRNMQPIYHKIKTITGYPE